MRHSAAGLFATRVLVYTHRWLGIVLGAVFAAWFVSGVFLMYAGMPRLAPGERLARLQPLDFHAATIGPADAADAAGGAPDSVRLGMLAGRPVYRIRSGAGSVVINADDGETRGPVDADLALAEARSFAPEHGATAHYGAYVAKPDQWTLEIRRQLPLHRIDLGDPEATALYVAESSGEIVLKTTATSRRWAYPGAILHWIYLTPIRRHAEEWAQLIIWTSVAGTLMCVAGLAWGIWRYSPGSAYRLKRDPSRSPYSGWMWWHHYAGLLFGLFSLTWIFSGLLSMDPWDWHPSTAPTAAQREAFTGGRLSVDGIGLADLQRALARTPGARDASIVQFQGHRWLAADGAVVPVEEAAAASHLDEGAIATAARHAVAGSAITDIATLTEYDAYYYDRGGELPLPVVRIRYDDPPRTWLYVDAVRGSVLRKEERLTRLNRWLYHGLHSLDFPFLYYRRPLWDIVVIVLSIGGLVLTVTTLVPACRRLLRHVRALRRTSL